MRFPAQCGPQVAHAAKMAISSWTFTSMSGQYEGQVAWIHSLWNIPPRPRPDASVYNVSAVEVVINESGIMVLRLNDSMLFIHHSMSLRASSLRVMWW